MEKAICLVSGGMDSCVAAAIARTRGLQLLFLHIGYGQLTEERELLAFKTGDRSILLWNVLDNHLTRSYDQAAALLDDLLAMEGNEEMNASFKWPDHW